MSRCLKRISSYCAVSRNALLPDVRLSTMGSWINKKNSFR